MKKIISIIFIVSSLTSCGQKHIEEIPDKIETVKTEKHIRIKGTKVYEILPNEYVYIKELARYQKKERQYIQVVESNASSFYEAKPKLSKQVFEAKGAEVDVYKNLRINEYEAIYVEGPSKNPNETKLGMFFGDSSFVVFIAAVCSNSDKESKEELKTILKSTFYDKAFNIDPFELANFEFDKSITNFKYAMTASNMFMFAENGKSDAQNPLSNSFYLSVLPKMSIEDLEMYSEKLISNIEDKGLYLKTKTLKKGLVNNYDAFILESKVNYNNNAGIIYFVALLGENSCVLFSAEAYSDLENYLLKYKKTAETIKIR